jgi:hypothetical protein
VLVSQEMKPLQSKNLNVDISVKRGIVASDDEVIITTYLSMYSRHRYYTISYKSTMILILPYINYLITRYKIIISFRRLGLRYNRILNSH